jgi:hypothetical protein
MAGGKDTKASQASQATKEIIEVVDDDDPEAADNAGDGDDDDPEDDFPGFQLGGGGEDDEDADDDDDEFIQFGGSCGSIVPALRELLTVKYTSEDSDEVTEEPVAYTVASIKDDLESFRELLEVVDNQGRVEPLGQVVAMRLDTIGRVLFKISRTLEAVAGKLGVETQTEKKASAA